MAVGDSRGHGGNDGYDDQVDAYYSWDSKVPNHKRLAVGDPVVLWDKKRLIGTSVIEEITRESGLKTLSRCPHCSTTRISPPKLDRSTFRCMKCKREFPLPEPDVVEVLKYRARYDAAWTSLDGLLGAKELKGLAVHRGDINAMRPLRWDAFKSALVAQGADRAVGRMVSRTPDLAWGSASEIELASSHGHVRSLVRVRRGQQRFREETLARQGQTCAFTGSAPARALEAGHLYSYASIGTHFEHGGLMLRRDVHTLFDDGSLAVHPHEHRIDVSTELAGYPQYTRLHGAELAVEVSRSQARWLTQHWEEHRV